jgi:hypothetical protein
MYEDEYRKLRELLPFVHDEPNVADMVGWDESSRSARFAKMYVMVNAMDESTFNLKRNKLLKESNYDIMVFRR